MTSTETAPYVARGPEDLIAMVPLALGFMPRESVTMLTFGGPRALQARIDLPDDRRDDRALVAVLLEPARAHRVERVAFVVHTRRSERFEEAGTALVVAFLGADVEVVDVLRADGCHYWCLDCLDDPEACQGHAYDVSAHRFVVRSVVEGHVTLGSREELAATLLPSTTDVARRPVVADAVLGHRSRLATVDLPREERWLRDTVRRHVTAGTRPDDRRLGRLLADLEVVGLRDRVWEGVALTDARAHVDLWRDALRRAPQEQRPPAAAVLAYAAWLAGDGALAWCSIDRGRQDGGDLELLGFVDDLLTSARAPSEDVGARHRSRRGRSARGRPADRVVVRGPW